MSQLWGFSGSLVKLIIEADGGSRGNPGVAGAGAVVLSESGELLREISVAVGIATNNVAEYTALIAALEAALEIDPQPAIEVRMDSKLVIEQMAGRWKIKHPDMQQLASKAQRLAQGLAIEYLWIPREQNQRADALANRAMDGNATPSAAVEFNRAEPSSIRAPRPTVANSTTLILVRHGRTELTESRRISGSSGEDPALSELGLRDAAEAANHISTIGTSGGFGFVPAPQAVIHSPLLRARQTAEKIATRNSLELLELADLTEISFGEWDGLTNEEVFAGYESQYQAWRGSLDVPPPGGESLKDFAKRIDSAFDWLMENYAGSCVVVVAHVMPIRGLLKIAQDAPLSAFWRPNIAPASLSIARYWGREESELICLNSTGHLSS